MGKAEHHTALHAPARSTSRFRGPGYQPLKRLADLTILLLLMPMCVPLMLLIAVAIKLHSPGPVFYRQQRIGKNGIPFTMLKFRSMRVGSDTKLHRDHVQRLIRENIGPAELGATSLKITADPRITGIGKLIRKIGLDELPQLINVLRGEMSIVGPRPPLPYEYELYNERHKQRLQVLPGITGLWQIEGRNQVTFEQMIDMDLAYIQSMNLWTDLQIIVRTPITMLSGKGGG